MCYQVKPNNAEHFLQDEAVEVAGRAEEELNLRAFLSDMAGIASSPSSRCLGAVISVAEKEGSGGWAVMKSMAQHAVLCRTLIATEDKNISRSFLEVQCVFFWGCQTWILFGDLSMVTLDNSACSGHLASRDFFSYHG